MKILYIIDGLFMGGAERNTLNLMAALESLGVEPHLCTLSREKDSGLASKLRLDQARCHDINVQRVYDFRGIFKFLRLVRRERFDCIHVEDEYANLLALSARACLGIPCVMTRHVMGFPAPKLWDRWRFGILYRAASLCYDRAVVVADALRPHFIAQYGIPRFRIRTIHNGVMIRPDRRQQRRRLREALGWRADAPIALMVAVLRGGKGHETLFQAMSDVLTLVPDAELKIVGDGVQRAELERAGAFLGNAVSFLGERLDVEELMAASDIVVLPSESEALPTVLLEAAVAGLPVVATNVGGIPEIVEDGVTGLLVPTGDVAALSRSIATLLENNEQCGALGDNARKRAEKEFSIEIQARRTLSVYKEIVSSRKNALAKDSGLNIQST